MSSRIRVWCALALAWLVLASPATPQTHDHATMAATDGEFNPYVAGDNRGGFYVAFIESKGGVRNLMLQHSNSNGEFSASVRVNNRPGEGAVRNENPPKIAVGSGGEVYVVWASERERWKGNIKFARSLNGGKTFEPALDLNSDAALPPVSRAFQAITVDANGRIYIAWIDERNKTAGDRGAEIWMVMSSDRGKTFTADRRILGDVCECCRIALAVDSKGSIYLSYRRVPPGGPMLRDIALARSDDDGKTFKMSVVHHDGWELDACPIAGATMTVDTADRVHIVWFTQTADLPRLYIASSTDYGVSFGRPKVFDSAQKLAKHAHAVAVSGDRVLIAWDDVNPSSTVKWGLFDTSTGAMKMLGTHQHGSYPIIASSGDRIAVVSLQPNQPRIFRRVQAAAGP